MLARIQSPTWLALLTRFGIAYPPAFDLNSVVQPVVIVDSSIPISVQAQDVLLGTPASAGEVANPAANTRLADTGALAAGNWTFSCRWAQNLAAVSDWRIRRRDAADAADVWSSRMAWAASNGYGVLTFRSVILTGERLVIENTSSGVGGTFQASIFATQG